MSVSNLRYRREETPKHSKVAFKAADMQIDNQLSRSHDAIILKREGYSKQTEFVSLQYLFVKNQAIENLLYFKYLLFELTPFELNIDGNFCDESYKYALDVIQLATKYAFKTKHRQIVGSS